jgi:hypothetical protein
MHQWYGKLLQRDISKIVIDIQGTSQAAHMPHFRETDCQAKDID